MSYPLSLNTQSLGELSLQDDSTSYRPLNENQYRFLLQAQGDPEPQQWTTLIDQRVPDLNSNWAQLLSLSPQIITPALAEQGLEVIGSETKLQHITLMSNGLAILSIALGPSEESLLLEVNLDANNHILSAQITR